MLPGVRSLLIGFALTLASGIVTNVGLAQGGEGPDPVVGDLLCPAGQVLQGIDMMGNKICVPMFRPEVRIVTGRIVDTYHNIAQADCASDEIAIGGRCQCHASGTWIAGSTGNSYQCACAANPQYVSALAVCMKVAPAATVVVTPVNRR